VRTVNFVATIACIISTPFFDGSGAKKVGEIFLSQTRVYEQDKTHFTKNLAALPQNPQCHTRDFLYAYGNLTNKNGRFIGAGRQKDQDFDA
jgi:hypothetical protein